MTPGFGARRAVRKPDELPIEDNGSARNEPSPEKGPLSLHKRPLKFACDAMLGGLSRWLRAFGYDAFYRYGIEDTEIVEIAREREMLLLTSDSKLMERRIIAGGELPALYIPHGLTKKEQLRYVVDRLKLQKREPRCMACGGALKGVRKEDVWDEIPPRTRRWLDAYSRCTRCGKLLWEGTHWERITSWMDSIAEEGPSDE